MKYLELDATRTFDVVPLGRVAIDFNPVDLNRPLYESSNFNKYVGGSSANIAVGLARLGKKVGFISKVSDDQFGVYATRYFENEGIDTSSIFKGGPGENLGLTFTEIVSPTESRILMYRTGVADLNLNMDEIREAYIRNTKILLITGTALAASPSREAALKAVELARKNGTFLVFVLDYRAYTWKSPEEIALYYSIIGRNSDMIIGSREEYSLMESLMATNSTDEETARRWLGFNNRIVVITHGKEGSTAFTAEGGKFSIKPFPTNVTKSFGGGDGYTSALLYGLMEGWEITDALEFGSASASLLVSAHSCSAAMPTPEAVHEFIRAKKAEYGEMIARA